MNTLETIEKVNIFIKNLLIIKNNKVVLGLITKKGWLMQDKFIIDFVKDSNIAILNSENSHRSQAFDTYRDILKNSDGLSDHFDIFFRNATLVSVNVESWPWKTYNQLNKKIKDIKVKVKRVELTLNPKP